MDPIMLSDRGPGEYSLTLVAGITDVDDLIRELDHEPNGPFWHGIVELLVATEAPGSDGRFEPDPEGGPFIAFSDDRAELEELAALLSAVVTDRDRVRRLMERAEATGFEFDD